MPNWLLDARVVPWSSWAEWAEVRRLARGDKGEQARAHAIVTCWRLRRGAVMPIALQSDVSLRLLLADERAGAYEWRLSVAMALVRLVNGLTDRLQGARARSVKALSEQLALPDALVAVRHAATHNALPRADALAAAARAALQWIDAKYWAPQASAASCGPPTLAHLHRVFEDDAKLPTPPSELVPQFDTLEQMRGMTALLKEMKQTSKNSSTKSKGRKRWRACGNEEAWKRTPLGLCPWQTEVRIDLTPSADVTVPETTELGASVTASTEHNEKAEVMTLTKRRRLDIDDLESAKRLSSQLLAA